MKMQPEHVQVLRAAIQPLDTEERRELYRAHPLSNMRYRWDLLWAVSRSLPDDFVCKTLYAYLDDTHIDTALRTIVPPLTAEGENHV